MRSTQWAKWASCALAISICVPVAFADRGAKRSLASCTSFDQQDKGDDGVQFTLQNSCTVPVDCTVSWRVVCAPDSKKRKTTHAGSAKLALADANAQSAQASAAVCGDDGWAIDSITWSCEPNKD
jgi:hypothetical protein